MTSQPGWHPDPHDPRAEIYWTGYQWGGRRPRFAYPAPQPYPQYAAGSLPVPQPKQRISTWKALLITAVCIVALFAAFVAYAVATGPKTEFERCVRNMEGGLHETREQAEEFCRSNQRMERYSHLLPEVVR